MSTVSPEEMSLNTGAAKDAGAASPRSKALDLLAETEAALLVVDMSQRIVGFNRAAESLLGYRAEEVLGKWCCSVFVGISEEDARVCNPNCTPILWARQGRAPASRVLLVRPKEGSPRWLCVSHLLLRPGKRQPRILVHVLHDLTEEIESTRVMQRIRAFLCQSPVVPTLPGRVAYPGLECGETLTAREVDVLQRLARGLSTDDIARELTVSPATVRNCAQRLMSKLGAHSRLQAVAEASRRGLL